MIPAHPFENRCPVEAASTAGNKQSPKRNLQGRQRLWRNAPRQLLVLVVFAAMCASMTGCLLLSPRGAKSLKVFPFSALFRIIGQLTADMYGVDPASPQASGTPPYYPFLMREADCSLTRVVIDSTSTVVETDPNYQDFLHQHLQISTTPDQFPNGCNDPSTGIAMEQAAVVGKLSGGSTAIAVVSTDGVLTGVISSTGTVSAQQDHATVPSNNPNSVIFGIASADLNGDGVPDIVVASEVFGQSAGTLSIFLGNGDGTFTAGQVLTVPQAMSSSLGFTIDDVNGDSKLDLVAVTTPTSGSGITVFLGKGDGTFPTTGVNGPSGANGSIVISADFNNDTKKDLATNTGQILLGNGDGTYTLQAGVVGVGQLVGLAAADFNKDGKLDLAFSNASANTTDIYNGKGDGTFTYSASYPAIAGFQNLDASDLNGDGFPDLFVGTAHGGVFTSDLNTAAMFQSRLNSGDGTLGKLRAYLPSNFVMQHFLNSTNSVFDVADFTGDGKPDIATLDFSSSGASISVLKGNGDGTFQQPGIETAVSGFTAPLSAAALVAGDLNGDGKNDVVFAWTDGSNNGHVSVALGKGDGTFQTQTNYAVPGSGMGVLNGALIFGNDAADGIVLADVNGDGKPDIVFIASAGAGRSATSSLYVMLNTGGGALQSPQLIDSKPYLKSVAAGDVNGDGKADIVVATGDMNNQIAAAAFLYISKGDGTFQSLATLAFGSDYPGPVAIADVNGDGKADLIFAGEDKSFEGGKVQVLPGKGDGTFQSPVTTAHPVFYPSSIAMADILHNGKLDVLLGGCCGNVSTFAMPGNGDGTFDATNSGFTFLGTSSVYLKLVDINGDGTPELFEASSGNSTPLAIDVFVSSPQPALTGTNTALQASATTITQGQSVMFSATVTPQSGSGTPTGSVNFIDGSTTIGNGTLNGSGVATFSTSTLAVGTHSIAASYAGDTTFAASTSSAVSVTVNSSAPPDFTLGAIAANPPSGTIDAGDTATFTITVTPTNGFAGSVTFACSPASVPPHSTCTPNPPSLTFNSSSAQTSTLSVATTARNLMPVAPRPVAPLELHSLNVSLSLALMFASAFFALRKRRIRLALGCALVAGVILVGCGGGKHAGSSGTPAATYMITITAASGGTTHSTMVTLTVN